MNYGAQHRHCHLTTLGKSGAPCYLQWNDPHRRDQIPPPPPPEQIPRVLWALGALSVPWQLYVLHFACTYLTMWLPNSGTVCFIYRMNITLIYLICSLQFIPTMAILLNIYNITLKKNRNGPTFTLKKKSYWFLYINILFVLYCSYVVIFVTIKTVIYTCTYDISIQKLKYNTYNGRHVNMNKTIAFYTKSFSSFFPLFLLWICRLLYNERSHCFPRYRLLI